MDTLSLRCTELIAGTSKKNDDKGAHCLATSVVMHRHVNPFDWILYDMKFSAESAF